MSAVPIVSEVVICALALVEKEAVGRPRLPWLVRVTLLWSQSSCGQAPVSGSLGRYHHKPLYKLPCQLEGPCGFYRPPRRSRLAYYKGNPSYLRVIGLLDGFPYPLDVMMNFRLYVSV